MLRLAGSVFDNALASDSFVSVGTHLQQSWNNMPLTGESKLHVMTRGLITKTSYDNLRI